MKKGGRCGPFKIETHTTISHVCNQIIPDIHTADENRAFRVHLQKTFNKTRF